MKKIKSTNSVQRSSRKTALDILDGILAEKGTNDQKLIENEKLNNVRRGPTLNENFMKWKNSKSEKELNENFPLKFEGASADRWKSKLAGNNSTYKGKKPKNCENSFNDEKLIYAGKSTAKKKLSKVDKAANFEQANDAEKSISTKAANLKQSKNSQKSTSVQKSSQVTSDILHQACNNTTSNAKKQKKCENSINDEKLIYARKSTNKEKPNKVDKAKYSASREKSNAGKKSIDELMSEVVESSGRFFCPENCGKFFRLRGHLPKHLLSHRPKNQWPFVCLFCGQTFQARADLPKHFKTSKHSKDSRIPKQDTPAWVDMMAKSVNKI